MKRAKISISLHQQALCKHHTDQFLSSLFPSLLFSLQSLHCLFFICVYLYSRLCNAASWDVIDRLLPEWKESTQHWECQTWSTESTAGLPSARNIQAYWSKSRAEPQRWLRNWSNSYHQRLKEMGLQTADQKVQGNLINLDKYPAGGNEEEADDHRQDALTGPAGARGLGCADLKRSFPS